MTLALAHRGQGVPADADNRSAPRPSQQAQGATLAVPDSTVRGCLAGHVGVFNKTNCLADADVWHFSWRRHH